MKIVVSPAKTLEYERELPTQKFTRPAFLKEARQINKVLKAKTPGELTELMDISLKLGDLNWQRNQSRTFVSNKIGKMSRQAMYAFNGDVYIGLDSYTIPLEKIDLLQDRLRILTGLYGLLKPLDLIQPYRLEMGTTLPVESAKNLYEFWKAKLTKALNKEMKKGELLVNLASNEYFSALDMKTLKSTVITPEFRDYKDGRLIMISFFAKQARGMMVRYIIDTNAETVNDLKCFDYGGYAFDESLSEENRLVFTR